MSLVANILGISKPICVSENLMDLYLSIIHSNKGWAPWKLQVCFTLTPEQSLSPFWFHYSFGSRPFPGLLVWVFFFQRGQHFDWGAEAILLSWGSYPTLPSSISDSSFCPLSPNPNMAFFLSVLKFWYCPVLQPRPSLSGYHHLWSLNYCLYYQGFSTSIIFPRWGRAPWMDLRYPKWII